MEALQAFEEKETFCVHQYEDVKLPCGTLAVVHIGHGGILAETDDHAKPGTVYRALREILGTTRIMVYAPSTGLYDPLRDMCELKDDPDAEMEKLFAWLEPERPFWDERRIEDLAERLNMAVGAAKGQYVDQDGRLHIRKNGIFRPASVRSSECMFYCTLFGGVLGIHRFYSGKVLSGVIYLLTGGLLGVGWLLDLLSLFLSVQRDKQKQYFAPLNAPLKKACLLPIGVLLSLLLLFVYGSIAASFWETLGFQVASHFQGMGAESISGLISGFWEFIENITDYFSK